MSRIFRNLLSAVLVLSFTVMLNPVLAEEPADSTEYRQLRGRVGEYDSAADRGDSPLVKMSAEKIKDLLSSYRFQSTHSKFKETVDIVVKQGDKGEVLQSLLSEGISSHQLVHHYRKGLRHYKWNVDQNAGDKARQHRISGAIELLVRSKQLDVTGSDYVSEMKHSYGFVSNNVVAAYYDRGVPADFLEDRIDAHSWDVFHSSRKKEVRESKRRLAILLEHDSTGAAVSVRQKLLKKLVESGEYDDLTIPLLKQLPSERKADLDDEKLKSVLDAALGSRLKLVIGESAKEDAGDKVLEEIRFLFKETGSYVRPELLDRVFDSKNYRVCARCLKGLVMRCF